MLAIQCQYMLAIQCQSSMLLITVSRIEVQFKSSTFTIFGFSFFLICHDRIIHMDVKMNNQPDLSELAYGVNLAVYNFYYF